VGVNLKTEAMKMTDKEKKILYALVQGMSKKELFDAISAGAKLTKADAGRLIATMTRKEFKEFLIGSDKITLIDAIAASGKLTKADAGRVVDQVFEAIANKLKTVFGGKGQ